MLIPLSSLERNPSNSRRHNNMTSRRTKIVTYKRSLLLTIGILGIIHYYRSVPYNNQHTNEKKLSGDKITHVKEGEASSSSSYLYPPQEAYPFVIDYNPNDNDFQKSNSPKVIEFYDPKCGACQAFKYNYIEVAKKIKEDKPTVQFYGVSCEVYKSLCDEFGAKRFPTILVFPQSNNDGSINKDDGIVVPKGTGTIYFVSARLMKALRTKEEIERDRVDSSKLAAGI
eukprot:scaffold26714_cov160-Skeletonema_menzelii.AAC.5